MAGLKVYIWCAQIISITQCANVTSAESGICCKILSKNNSDEKYKYYKMNLEQVNLGFLHTCGSKIRINRIELFIHSIPN